MTVAEIHEVIDLFVNAALRAQKAGFDGVQMITTEEIPSNVHA